MPQLFERFLNRSVHAVSLQQSSQTLRLFSALHFINGCHAPGKHLLRRLDSCDPARLLTLLALHNCPGDLHCQSDLPKFLMNGYQLYSIIML
jgi:hypothetical protein